MLLLRARCVLPARRLAWRRVPFRDPPRRTSGNAPLWRACSSSSSSTADPHDAVCSPSPSERAVPAPKLAKRKLALHIGYVGTNYRGLQWQPPSQTAAAEAAAGTSYRPPVENVLERALTLSGAITEANSGNPAKVGWTRSSRTDAGVHSVSTVVSLRAECLPERFEVDPEGAEFAESVNAHLPGDVRVFSAQRVNGGWCARGMCESREYEYTLPSWILLPGSGGGGGSDGERAARLESAVDALERVLGLYLGHHPFHNFTVRREYRPQGADGRTGVGRRGLDPRGSDRRARLGRKGDGEGGGESSTTTTTSSSSLAAAGSSSSKDQRPRPAPPATPSVEGEDDRPLLVKPYWLDVDSDEARRDRIGPAHWRRVDDASVVRRLIPLVPGGESAVTVRISGGSFMLRQLRHMVGAAVAVARGSLPSAELVAASLRVPARVSLPLAPPHTLVLTGAFFGKYPEKALAPGDPAPWVGERLELRQSGEKNAASFREGPLGTALSDLLDHEDWRLWARQLDRLAWDEGDVGSFVAKAREDERLARERRREREKEREEQREEVEA